MGPRRLPIYLVVDCSSSLAGDPLDQVRRGIEALLADLRSDPVSLETAYISLITFADNAQQLTTLTSLDEFHLPPLKASGGSALGAALRLLVECLEREVRRPTPMSKGDWKPLIFLMTLGNASDEWRVAVEQLKQAQSGTFLVCVPGGPTNRAVLNSLPGSPCELANIAPSAMKSFFKWCSSSIRTTDCAPDTAEASILPLRSDLVNFSVSAPAKVLPGQHCVLDVWIFMSEQREEMIKRAQQEAGSTLLRHKSKGAVKLERGTLLRVRVAIPGFEIPDPEDIITWEGEIGNASFPVTTPAFLDHGTYPGSAQVYANGLQVAKIHFVMEVASQTCAPNPIPSEHQTIRTAFASYASADRDAVLARVQGIQKALPDLDIFLDVASLRSGQVWSERLSAEILRRDVFYLFWSKAASQSEWVRREWQFALSNRGPQFIDPVPLVDPQETPPPPELAECLHFNDWVLAYMRRPRHDVSVALPPPPPGTVVVP